MGEDKNFNTLVTLQDNTADIWIVPLDLSKNGLRLYSSLLSPEERVYANRFKFDKDKQCYTVCRGVLRMLSGKYLRESPKEIKFSYNQYGKPRYTNNVSLHFNVSHSSKLATICFLRNKSVGIDIELVKNDFDILDIAKSFFSKEEMLALASLDKENQHLGFYRCWTRKEAFIKAKGSGLSFSLDSFVVSLDSDEQATLIDTKWNENEKNEWTLYSFVPLENYRGALAIRDRNIHINTYKWSHTNQLQL